MNELKLDSVIFKVDENNSLLTYSLEKNIIKDCDIDINFLEAKYQNEEIAPEIVINTIQLNATKLENIKGKILETKSVEESVEREDFLLLSESEPFEKLMVEIVDIDENMAHIKLTGVAITDGYAKPYKKEKFTLETKIKVKSYDVLKKENTSNKQKSKSTRVGLTIMGVIIAYAAIKALMSGNSSRINVILSIGLILIALALIFIAWKTKNKK